MIHRLSRTALLATAGATLAACTTTSQLETPKPNFPIQTPAEPAASAAPATSGDEPPPQARPTAPVDARPIEPPRPGPGAAAQPNSNVIRVANQQASASPPRQTITRTVTGGRVIDVEVETPGKTHKVQSGETLYRIALGFGMKAEDLAKLNGLKPPYTIRPGQVLRGPGGKTRSKAYVVEQGDTLGAIAQRFGVGVAALASANDIKTTDTLRPGQRVKLPAGFKDKGPQTVTVVQAAPAAPPPSPPPARVAEAQPRPAPAPPPPPASEPARTQLAVASSPPARSAGSTPPPMAATPPPAAPPAATTPAPRQTAPAAPPSTRQPAPPPASTVVASAQPTRPAPTPPPAARPSQSSGPVLVPSSPPTADSEIAALGRGRFVWPVRGQVISTFGPKGGNQRNDGVKIRAPAGEAVRAAAAGEVVYAGDQVPGFGNLVLIKHADGWVSAYGHLSRIDVKIQQRLGQGQQIGQIGASGGVGEPQLHFEIRYAPTPADRARPIDPQLVLPQS